MTEYGEHELYEDYRDWQEKPDEPVPFWPDDDYLANYGEPDRLEDLGHA